MSISKRLCALTAAIVLSIGVIAGYAEEGEETVPAEQGEDQGAVTEPSEPPVSLDDAVRELEEQEQSGEEEQSGQQEEQSEQSGEEIPTAQSEQKPAAAADDPYKGAAQSSSFNITPYAERLREIGEEQKKLDEQIRSAEEQIEKTDVNLALYTQYLDNIKAQSDVIASYATRLEIDINDNKRKLEKKQKEIDTGIDAFKKRLRALYLSGGGNDSYLSVLLSSKDFYDVMMRMELVKRIAQHDDGVIESLTEAKAELEKIQQELDAKQKEYDKQLEKLADLERTYDSFLARNKLVRDLLSTQITALEAKNDEYVKERQQFESGLSDILKSSYGNSAADTERLANELEANEALKQIHAALEGREPAEGECRYVFKWPVPGYYYISSGVGARWGRYHNGIDIPGPKGTQIHSAESGTVLRINNSCPHDYGKEESCGCGGGYGNYVLIDHGNGFLTLYGHMTKVLVQPGDKIRQGDVIGLMGSTGYSTGDHLHFEIRFNGKILNPAAFVVISE